MELKPCPFCGSKKLDVCNDAEEHQAMGMYCSHSYWIKCLDCSSLGPPIVVYEKTTASDAWNNRNSQGEVK